MMDYSKDGMGEIIIKHYHYTVGMAGHIDHGKTTLTKALTNIDTDRLKEEKERQISIELGYAPLSLTDNLDVSIVDVPGHERFIRQMIAGVAGIDLVILVIAADEGVMPQTKEHLDILSFLEIKKGIIVLSKVDRVDDAELLELVKEDVLDHVKGTVFADAPIIAVDSISKRGINELKEQLVTELTDLPVRSHQGPFRLPIDQVFTVHGQGTVVRGTVYEGTVNEGDMLEVLPLGAKVRARQIQVHHEQMPKAIGGQRAAVNIGGVSASEVKRGDVLVAPNTHTITNTIDISLQVIDKLKYELKQRANIKIHTGTAEVYGKIVFFDRNKIDGGEKVLCQCRLDEAIVVKKGDRFILRRPTPTETIGGGFVIEPQGEQYKFGENTIQMLEKKLVGTPEEIILDLLQVKKNMTVKEIITQSGISEDEVQEILQECKLNNLVIQLANQEFIRKSFLEDVQSIISEELSSYHEDFPLREGKKKAEIVQSLFSQASIKVIEQIIDILCDSRVLMKQGPYLALPDFQAGPPKKWAKRIEHVVLKVKDMGLQVSPLLDVLEENQIPKGLHEELKHYLLREKILYEFDEKLAVHNEPLHQAVNKLKEKTGEEFTLQNAKEILGLSRKYLVSLLELLDSLNYTTRIESRRVWKK
ncbi:selenocysteine-specific translation elongation factor [Bacillus sp. FJAT-45350]|uniref:selenocysteine-specific translation elongation factor n=1 Tax=Bacillus sp. FJAT-45350 TaxID=2011014 RepID=UPI00211C1DE4|nr:selenocysteine-specific translation elongation factor [Bacillus sp. FJAT-45350]